MNLCECGCGREVKNRFAQGHQHNGKNNPNYGIHYSIETHKNHYGRHHTDNTKKKLSITSRENHADFNGKNNPMWNKRHTEESKKKIRENSQMGYSLKGHITRSFAEKLFADLLYVLGEEYEYEPQIFDLRSGLKYRPDFYIPRLNLYVEIKSEITRLNELQYKLFIEQGYKLLVIMNSEVDDLDKTLDFLLKVYKR